MSSPSHGGCWCTLECRHSSSTSRKVQKAGSKQAPLTCRAPYFLQAAWTSELCAYLLRNQLSWGPCPPLAELSQVHSCFCLFTGSVVPQGAVVPWPCLRHGTHRLGDQTQPLGSDPVQTHSWKTQSQASCDHGFERPVFHERDDLDYFINALKDV